MMSLSSEPSCFPSDLPSPPAGPMSYYASMTSSSNPRLSPWQPSELPLPPGKTSPHKRPASPEHLSVTSTTNVDAVNSLVDEEFLTHYRVRELMDSLQYSTGTPGGSTAAIPGYTSPQSAMFAASTYYDYYDSYQGGSMSDIGYGGGPSPDIKIGIEELCPVCGDKVSGYHYGLQTCESCKGFFKRTVQNKKVYSCVDNRNCLIDKTQRKRCPYCRFQKCISVGMKLEAVRADRMRGGRNKFGPMYKRDRALKQQAIRQRQQMFAQMQYTMQFNGLQGPPGMPPGMMDGYMGPNSDIKPNIAMLGLPSPHEGSPPGHMGPPGPPPPGYYHPRGMYHDGPLSPNGLPHPPASLHQSSHGGYLPPPGPPPGPPQHHYPPPPPPHNHMMMNNHGGHHSNTSSSSSMPPPHPAHHPLPPDMDRHLPPPPPPPHSNHGDLVSMATGVPSVPSPPPPATNSGVPQLIRDLQKNEPDPHDIQVKLAGIADMMMAQTSLHGDGALPGQDSGDGELSKSMLQLVCRICDQALFLLVEWARGAYFFRDLRVEDQMKLLQNCWSELLILDFVFKQMAHSKPRHLLLGTGHMVSIDALDQVGLSDVKERLVDLASKLRDLKLDHNEFTCLKFLILLNPDVVGLLNRAQVEDYQKKVNLTLLDYCTAFYGGIHDKCGQLLIRLPEVRLFSLRAEDYLYFQHISGNIPENTLLMEMLHSKRK